MPWCAQRKRPSGGCALAGTRLHGVADREGSWIDLTRSPYPSPLLGRPGAPLAAFLPESAISLICRVRAAEGARSKEEAEEGEGSRVRCRHSGEGGSEPDKKPLGRPAARTPGRKDAAKRVRRTEAEQRDAAVTAGLVNALGGTQPPQKPEQLVLYGREPRGGEKRKQLFVAALFASFVCCSQMTNRSLRLSTQFI